MQVSPFLFSSMVYVTFVMNAVVHEVEEMNALRILYTRTPYDGFGVQRRMPQQQWFTVLSMVLDLEVGTML